MAPWSRVLIGLIGGLAFLVVVPAAWLLLAHVAGLRIGSTQDPLALVVGLGSVMGAIFTVGGLVVALAAVLTVLTVENRVTQAFNAQLPDLQRRADRQITGYITLLRADQAADWATAQTLTEDALEEYPDLPGARSALGLRMADEVIAFFTIEHGTSVTDTASEFAPLSLGRPPLDDAVDWLQRALDRHDDAGGWVSTALVLMYGAQRRYDPMMRALQRIGGDSAALAHLRQPRHLIMLAHACANDAERVRQLGDALGLHLPVPRDTVLGSIVTLDIAHPTAPHSHSPCVECYVLGRPDAWGSTDLTRFPRLVRIFVSATGQGDREAQPTIPGAFLEARQDYFSRADRAPADGIVTDLDAWFLFITADKKP